MTYIDGKGRRVSAESAYLTSEVLKRPNLTICTQVHVTKVLIDTIGEQKRATGVEFALAKGGTLFQVKARKQVILWCVFSYYQPRFRPKLNYISSAGAIYTPHVRDTHSDACNVLTLRRF